MHKPVVSAWLVVAVVLVSPGCGNSISQDGAGGTPPSGGRQNGGTIGFGGSGSSGGVLASGGTQGGGSMSAAGGHGSGGGYPASGGRQGSGGASAGSSRDAGGGMGTGGAAGALRTGGNTSGGGGGTTGTGGIPASSDGGADRKWQMMTLGDSITETSCYPQFLAQALIEAGRTGFTFIGTRQANQDCGGVPPVPTEGHGGYLVTYLTSDSHKSENRGTMTELLGWAAAKPDVVLMQYGTNDCWTSSIPIADITSAYSFVLDEFRAKNPKVIFFVAKITPLNPAGCSTCESRVESLNAQIPAWATSRSTSESPVYVVDVFSALDPKTYLPNSTWTKDGCHPLAPAAQLMAAKWYTALVEHGLP